MTDFVERLQLKGQADEDIYFAKQDRELLDALHRRQLGAVADCEAGDQDRAAAFEDRFQAVTDRHRDEPGRLLSAYRRLLDEINALCRRRGD
jgi:hypothetical protein